MKKKTRILIVDDHVMIRLGLVEAINGEPDFKVVGQAGNSEEALAIYPQRHADVVIMDFQMPGADGAAATSRVLALHPNV